MMCATFLLVAKLIDEIAAAHEDSIIPDVRSTKIHGAEIIEVGGAGGHYPLPTVGAHM